MTFTLFLSRTSPKYHHALGVNYFVIKIFSKLIKIFYNFKRNRISSYFSSPVAVFCTICANPKTKQLSWIRWFRDNGVEKQPKTDRLCMMLHIFMVNIGWLSRLLINHEDFIKNRFQKILSRSSSWFHHF